MNQEQRPTVRIRLVVDESGSMTNKRAEVVENYNEYIRGLLEDGNFTYDVKTLFFNSAGRRWKLDGNPLTLTDYCPANMTPLYDAVGEAIMKARQESNERNLVIIMTDGEENFSREYTKERISELIKECQQSGWEFIYLGENIEAWQSGVDMGIGNTYLVGQDYRAAYGYAKAVTMAYAASGSGSGSGAPTFEQWSAGADNQTGKKED